MHSFIQVVTTTDRKEDAERIARALVEDRLAACVQLIGPVRSTYWWKGRVETAEEWQCWAKTEAGFYEEVEKAIRAIHPYELPEIVAMPILRGSPEYLEWLRGELRG
jgi:periplasmic divalent cation tolerance protein